MSPHQSKTGVYVFFAFRAKLIHVFVFFLLLCVVSCCFSLSFFLSLANLSLSSSFSLFPFFFFFCVDHCVARANLCRRRSVAFCPHFPTGPCQKRGEMHTHTRNRRTQYWEHIVVEGDRTMVTGERKMHFTGCGWWFLWVGCACVFGAWIARVGRGTTTVVVRSRKCPYLGVFFVHVDVTWIHDDVVAPVGRALDIHEIHCRPCMWCCVQICPHVCVRLCVCVIVCCIK